MISIETHLRQMEALYGGAIQQPTLEASSTNQPLPDDYTANNEDIRWLANEIADFQDEHITQYYESNAYGNVTRWQFFVTSIELLKVLNIGSMIDIGSANNHFVYLAKKAGVDAYGIEPRKRVLESSTKVFEREFGADRKYGFVGTIKTFADYVLRPEVDLQVDCVSVMNFLHGDGHKPEEITNLYKAFTECAKYVLISEPRWGELGLEKPTNLLLIGEYIGVNPHVLYEIIK